MIRATALLAMMTLLATIPPLDESQRARLESAADRSSTVDEAAFYALLENARDWPEGREAGARVPDYQQMREDPDAWRGELVLIEGRLQSLFPERRWSRSGWEAVRALVLRVDDEPNDVEPTFEDLVIVHLVNPPELTPTQHSGVFLEHNYPVRLVARFHKIVHYDRPRAEGAGEAPYLSFVGNGVSWMGQPEDNDRGMMLAMALLGGLLIALLFLLWRIRAFSTRDRNQPSKMEIYLAEKRARRAAVESGGDDEEDIDEIVERSNTPDDPADALEYLKRRRREGAED